MQDAWKEKREQEYIRIENELFRKDNALHSLAVYGYYTAIQRSFQAGTTHIIEPFANASREKILMAADEAGDALLEHCLNREKFISAPKPEKEFRL